MVYMGRDPLRHNNYLVLKEGVDPYQPVSHNSFHDGFPVPPLQEGRKWDGFRL